MAEVRVTRPCRRCSHEADCAVFIRELRELVDKHVSCTRHPLPDVCVECVLYTAARRP